MAHAIPYMPLQYTVRGYGIRAGIGIGRRHRFRKPRVSVLDQGIRFHERQFAENSYVRHVHLAVEVAVFSGRKKIAWLDITESTVSIAKLLPPPEPRTRSQIILLK